MEMFSSWFSTLPSVYQVVLVIVGSIMGVYVLFNIIVLVFIAFVTRTMSSTSKYVSDNFKNIKK